MKMQENFKDLDVNKLHDKDDLDVSGLAHHHSLGDRQNQAAPGNHAHSTLYSPLIHNHYLKETINLSVSTAWTWPIINNSSFFKREYDWITVSARAQLNAIPPYSNNLWIYLPGTVATIVDTIVGTWQIWRAGAIFGSGHLKVNNVNGEMFALTGAGAGYFFGPAINDIIMVQASYPTVAV